jgi:hypothetical protein
LKQYEDGELFERFKAQHRDVVWEEVLKPRRAAEGNPNWFPRNWAEGVGYQSEVYKILRERFAQQAGSSGPPMCNQPSRPSGSSALRLHPKFALIS